MANFENQVDKIREFFDEMKAERYPLTNELLSKKEQYIKSLYLRMLCVLIRYTGEASKMQMIYVKRIIAGINAEETYKDYMKMALNINESDFNEFIDVFKDDITKYYFVIDGIILLYVNNSTDKQYGLLAELVELLEIDKKELEYLSALTKGIIEQSPEIITDAGKLETESLENLSLLPYLASFFTGTIVNNRDEYHLYSCDKAELSLTGCNYFNQRRVIIENITASIEDEIFFEGCEEVVIRNCNLTGREYPLNFKGVSKILVEGCRISCFSNRFLYFKEGSNIVALKGNRFVDCGHTRSDYRAIGGILYCYYGTVESVILENNSLYNCYVDRYYSGRATGVFFAAEGDGVKSIKVIGNHFSGCECRNNYSRDYEEGYVIGTSSGIQYEENNICRGKVQKIFCNW